MAKMVSGILTRDKSVGGWKLTITFWPGATRNDLRIHSDGCWNEGKGKCLDACREWSKEQWKEQYDLFDEKRKPCKLPTPGKCYEVEIEL